MPAKITRLTPRLPFVLPRGDGSRRNIASVLQESKKSVNTHVRLGAIWPITVEGLQQ